MSDAPLSLPGINPIEITLPQNNSAGALDRTSRTLSATNAPKKSLPVESFFNLLVQQIKGVDLPIQNLIPISIVDDSTAPTPSENLPEKKELRITSADQMSVNDPSNYLSSIMLQLPVQPNEAYTKAEVHDREIPLDSEHPTSDVQSSAPILLIRHGEVLTSVRPEPIEGYEAIHLLTRPLVLSATEGSRRTDFKYNLAGSISSVDSPFIQGTQSDLKRTTGMGFVADSRAQIPAVMASQIDSTDLPKTPPIQLPDAASSVIPQDIFQIENSLPSPKKNSTDQKPVNVVQKNAVDSSQKYGTPIEPDKLPFTSMSKLQTAVVSTDLIPEAVNNRDANIHIPDQAKNNVITAPANTLAISLTSLPSNTNNYLSTPLAPAINAPLGTDNWPNEFSQKIVWLCTQKNQIAELHLNPADLGPLNVTLKITNDQLTAQFTSPHSAVRDAVEHAMPQLREILAGNGILLNNVTVSDQPARDRNADGYSNQGERPMTQRELIKNTGNAIETISAKTSHPQTRRHNGILDIFA